MFNQIIKIRERNLKYKHIKAHPFLHKVSLAFTGLFMILGLGIAYYGYQINKINNDIEQNLDFNIDTHNIFIQFDNPYSYSETQNLINNLIYEIKFSSYKNKSNPLYNNYNENNLSLSETKEKFHNLYINPLTENDIVNLREQYKKLTSSISESSAKIKNNKHFPKDNQSINNQLNDINILINSENSLEIINTYRKNLLNPIFLNLIHNNPQEAWNKYFSEKLGNDISPVFTTLSMSKEKIIWTLLK